MYEEGILKFEVLFEDTLPFFIDIDLLFIPAFPDFFFIDFLVLLLVEQLFKQIMGLGTNLSEEILKYFLDKLINSLKICDYLFCLCC